MSGPLNINEKNGCWVVIGEFLAVQSMSKMDFNQLVFFYFSPVIAILACILNLPALIILAKRYRKLKHAENRRVPVILLISLAASDFLVGLTVILTKILCILVEKEILPSTHLNKKIHKVLNFLFLRLSLLTSIFNLLALTFDRLISIGSPISYRTKVQPLHGFLAVFISWSLSFVIISVHYYFFVYGEPDSLKYRLLVFPVTIIPASVIFTICYIKILRSIFVKGYESRRYVRHTGSRCPRYILEREFKVSRFAATVVSVFMICWLPLAFISLFNVFGIDFEDESPNAMFLLAFSNSILDPLIYFAFKERFCWRVRRFLSLFLQKIKIDR